MVAAGRPLDEARIMEYIIMGLDMEFNPIVSALIARMESIIVSELFSQLLSFETRMDHKGKGSNSNSSANLPNSGHRNGGNTHGCGGFGRGCGHGRGRGDGHSQGNGSGGKNNNSRQGANTRRNSSNNHFNNSNNDVSSQKITCQIYFRVGHMVDRCWHRFDEEYSLKRSMCLSRGEDAQC